MDKHELFFVWNPSILSIANSLNTSEHIIKKMIKLWRKGGIDSINKAKWGRGGYWGKQKSITEA